MRRIIAIDPGASGGMAWYLDDQPYCKAMPETDGDILDSLRKFRAEGISECHIEHVCGFVACAGAGQMFSFGEGFGFIKGCLMTLGYSVHLHRPQKMAEGSIAWQQERSWKALEESPEGAGATTISKLRRDAKDGGCVADISLCTVNLII